MSKSKNISPENLLPVFLEPKELKLLIIGGGSTALEKLQLILHASPHLSVTIVAADISDEIKRLAESASGIDLQEKLYDAIDLSGKNMVIVALDNDELIKRILSDAAALNMLVHVAGQPHLSDFQLSTVIKRKGVKIAVNANGQTAQIAGRINKMLDRSAVNIKAEEKRWKKIATQLIIAFTLMLIGHFIISSLPLPPIREIWGEMKVYFNYQFLLFVLVGFIAQMVDGMLSMGYGVTSATCLMSIGVNPVSISAAIHTSEVFTSGISGYSHYKFGNVNKKLFRHLVIPGIIGAILGAVLLVFLGENAGKWLMPLMAVYAMFLGFKILIKAFQIQPKNTKVKRVGWLAAAGGFLDSFGGGGWGPIVTSTLISKGKTPKYTIGSVSLTEFFVTLASAVTFFVTAGISHWNVVLGLLIGGAVAAPFAARFAGRLPRKTMMIAVGIMVMIWCVRMIIKSFT